MSRSFLLSLLCLPRPFSFSLLRWRKFDLLLPLKDEHELKRRTTKRTRRRNQSSQRSSFLPTRDDTCSASAAPTASAIASRSETSWIWASAASSLGPDAARGLSASASAFMIWEEKRAKRERKRKGKEREVKQLRQLLLRFRRLHHSQSKQRKKGEEKMQPQKGAVQATISLEGAQLHRVDVAGSGEQR